MAIVKVYNRDGSEYGELNTSAYVFNNDLVGFEPTKFDVNLYPYIKVNGVYYKNDGEEFYSRGRADNSSALMKASELYKYGDETNFIYKNDEAATDDDKKTWTSPVAYNPSTYCVGLQPSVYNFLIDGNSTRGGYSKKATLVDNYRYSKQLAVPGLGTGHYNKNALIYGCPYVVWSNMNRIEDISSRWKIENHSTGGTSDTIYKIDRKLENWVYNYYWYKVDDVNSKSDYGGRLYLNPEDKTGTVFPKQAKCIKTAIHSQDQVKLQITNDILYVNDVEYDKLNGRKVIVAVRPLKNIASSFSDWCYNGLVYDVPWLITNNEQGWGSIITVSPTATAFNKSSLGPVYWWCATYRPDSNDKQDHYVTYPVIWEKINVDAPASSWVAGLHKALTKDISGNEIEYYDVTTKLSSGDAWTILTASDMPKSAKITPTFKNDIETEYNKEVNFSFKGNVELKYKINFKWKGITSSAPEVTSETVNLKTETGNLERYTPSGNGNPLLVSKTYITQQTTNIKIPNHLFSDTFVSLSRGIWIAESTNDTHAFPRQSYYHYFDENYPKDSKKLYYQIWKLEDKQKAPYVMAGPCGWKFWLDKFSDYGPATTSLDAGNTVFTDNPTFFMHDWVYIEPHNGNDGLKWARYDPTYSRNALQIGFTCGFSFNRANINVAVIDSDGKYTGRFQETLPGIAIIICDAC